MTEQKQYDKQVIEFCDELLCKHKKVIPNSFEYKIIEHALVTLEFMINESKGGYDYDAQAELPFYEQCIKYLQERHIKRKKYR